MINPIIMNIYWEGRGYSGANITLTPETAQGVQKLWIRPDTTEKHTREISL